MHNARVGAEKVGEGRVADSGSVESIDLSAQSRTGLVLTGGGARAAYQVGVLRGIAR